MELTVNQIRERQRALKDHMEHLLNEFKEESGIVVTGWIDFGSTKRNGRPLKEQQFVNLKYSNPFEQ